MTSTKRLEAAIKRLYIAFHDNTLNPECCKQCAVGNILNKSESWKYLSDSHGSLNLNYVGKVHQTLGRKFNGYTPLEILKIERIFLLACGFTLPLNHKNKKPDHPTDKETLFKGLSAVIEYLCELDNVENVMSYKNIFINRIELVQKQNINAKNRVS